jgi:hypothetical protein
MTKKTRRRYRWQKTAKSKRSVLHRGAHNVALCKEFQKRLTQGGTVKELAAEMGVTQRTAYRWSLTVKVAAAEYLKRLGWTEAVLMEKWAVQAARSRGHVHNTVLRELGSILDVYPARKEPQLPVNPVTVIFNADLSQYEGEEYAPRELTVRPGFQIKPQGDAGSGTPSSAITRSSVRDSAQGSGRKKE